MASIADQSVAQLGGSSSVLARQRADHVELDRLLEQAQRLSGDEQDEVLQRTWRLVFRHAYAEETVLFPVIRASLADGDELTLRIEQEHQAINELVARLDRTRHDDPERPALLAEVVAALRQDVRDEEDVLLPRLQAAVAADRLHRLGRTWEVVRRTAPTRPHAAVSRRPPGNVLAALPLSLLDHGRDALDSTARRSNGRVRGLAETTSRTLAAVAGLIERVSALQTGEHPSTRTGARR